jgi:hypothetical protein
MAAGVHRFLDEPPCAVPAIGGCHVVVRVHGSSLKVQDDDPGILEEARERVFEPFQRLQPRQSGAGLGLNRCVGSWSATVAGWRSSAGPVAAPRSGLAFRRRWTRRKAHTMLPADDREGTHARSRPDAV